MLKNTFLKQKTNFFFRATIFIALLIVFLFIVSITGIYEQRDFAPNLFRFIRSINFSSENLPIAVLGFGTWGSDISDEGIQPIYLSYPISSYLLLSYVRALTPSFISTNLITFISTFTSIFLSSYLLFLSIVPKKNYLNKGNIFLGISSSLIFLVNPSILGIFVSPDWQLGFIFMSLLSLYLSNYSKARSLSSLLLCIAVYSNFMYGVALLIGSLLFIILDLLKRPKKIVFSFKANEITSYVQNLFIPFTRLKIFPVFLGLLFYLINRLIAFIYLSSNSKYTFIDSDLLTRVGLGNSSNNHHYGGILSVFKFFLNLPPYIEEYKLNYYLDGSVHRTINLSLLTIEQLLISSISFISLIVLISSKRENEYQLLNATKLNIKPIIGFFGLVLIFSCVLFPQSTAVHYRETARIFALNISTTIPYLSIKLSKFLSKYFKSDFSWLCPIIIFFTFLDFLRFSLSFPQIEIL